MQAPDLSPRTLFESATAQNLDAKAAILIGVSILELCLVIAMTNISLMQDTPFNFEVVYENYRDFVLHDSTMSYVLFVKIGWFFTVTLLLLFIARQIH